MPKFYISLRFAFLLLTFFAVAFILFRCQLLMVAERITGARIGFQLRIIETDDDLRNALERKNCMIVVAHDWSIEDKIIQKKVADSKEFRCTGKFGDYDVFVLNPTGPTEGAGETAIMYRRLDDLCGTNGKLPKFRRFYRTAGMVFIKTGSRIEWKPHDSYEDLKGLALKTPPSEG